MKGSDIRVQGFWTIYTSYQMGRGFADFVLLIAPLWPKSAWVTFHTADFSLDQTPRIYSTPSRNVTNTKLVLKYLVLSLDFEITDSSKVSQKRLRPPVWRQPLAIPWFGFGRAWCWGVANSGSIGTAEILSSRIIGLYGDYLSAVVYIIPLRMGTKYSRLSCDKEKDYARR